MTVRLVGADECLPEVHESGWGSIGLGGVGDGVKFGISSLYGVEAIEIWYRLDCNSVGHGLDF